MKKVALITGGAKGIGQAITLELAKQGYDVAINYFGSQELAQQTKKQALAFGVQAEIYQGDICDFEGVKQMVQTIHQDFGQIDVLVNNSGITKDGLLLRMDEQSFDQVLDLNLKGTFNTIRFVAPIMLRQRAGSIINISSVVGLIGNMGQANYAASKAGVIGLTKSVAKELASRHIRCNAIAPGFIESEMTAKMSDEAKQKITTNIPLQRLGKPEDVAHLVAFLSSDNSNYMTGQVLVIDGGLVI